MQAGYRHILSGTLLIALCILAVGSSSDIKANAFYMTHQVVTKRLKSPSSADFPAYDESFVRYLGKGRYRVSAYVDAQNIFGVKVRSGYTCVLRYKKGEGGEDIWTLESIEID